MATRTTPAASQLHAAGPFTQSTSGRLVLAAAAVFLATTGWYTITHNLYALGIGMPLAITLSFVSVGLGLGDGYVKQALFAVTVLPTALWGLMYLTGEMTFRHQPWSGYVMVVLAALCAAKAAMGGASSE
jgi:hypothetical protein